MIEPLFHEPWRPRPNACPVVPRGFFIGDLRSFDGETMYGPALVLGCGEKDLLGWFDVDAAAAGLRRLHGIHEVRHRAAREALLAELRKKHPDRIRRWWNR